MTHPDQPCDHCGGSAPGGLKRWRTEEVVRPDRHVQPQLRTQTLSAARRDRVSEDADLAPPIPTLRVAYASRAYDLCPACYAAATQEVERALAGQRRGMVVVAILGSIAFVWIILTAFLHSDILGRPWGDAKGWIYATPAPGPYKDPLRGLPSSP